MYLAIHYKPICSLRNFRFGTHAFYAINDVNCKFYGLVLLCDQMQSYSKVSIIRCLKKMSKHYIRLLNKPYENKVNLTWHNPPLKCCQSLEISTQLKRGLDLLMIKILDLQVKGLQSYWLSKFENDLTLDVLKPGPNALAHTSAEMAKAADFLLRTPTLTASNFAAL